MSDTGTSDQGILFRGGEEKRQMDPNVESVKNFEVMYVYFNSSSLPNETC